VSQSASTVTPLSATLHTVKCLQTIMFLVAWECVKSANVPLSALQPPLLRQLSDWHDLLVALPSPSACCPSPEQTTLFTPITYGCPLAVIEKVTAMWLLRQAAVLAPGLWYFDCCCRTNSYVSPSIIAKNGILQYSACTRGSHDARVAGQLSSNQ